jgi:small ligand-binding sensory domain FIST
MSKPVHYTKLMINPIQWKCALSKRPSLEAAVIEVTDAVKQSLSAEPDLGIVFISSAYASEYSRLIPLILERLTIPVIIGCGGGGIIGTNAQNQAMEIEGKPALSLSVGCLPDVEIHPFYILSKDLPDLDSSPEAWINLMGVSHEKQPHFILLSDSFSSRIGELLEGLDFAYPTGVKVGGLASSSSVGVANGLFYYSAQNPWVDALLHEGTVGVALSGEIVVDTIVAQGCRSIGQPYCVTKGERNIILEIAQSDSLVNIESNASSRPALEVLRDIIYSLNEKDRSLAEHSLFVGIARDEFKLELDRRDFLIRNLIGVDPKSGAIAIGDRVRPGQRIQFHLRDSETSAEDLKLLLKAYQLEKENDLQAIGALMFSCLGRGEALYGNPNFDSELFSRYLNNIPLGGFFCNGEIGQVGGRTFIHGYTSALAIFRQPNSKAK